MPQRAPKGCSIVGCPNTTTSRYCTTHADTERKQRKADPAERERLVFYSSAAWKKVRDVQLRGEPLCRRCMQKDVLTPACVADHIQPIKAGGERLCHDNLQSLCIPCHADKTAEDRTLWGT